MVTESKLERALSNSWSKDTSSDPENWTPSNPAWGQCAVTALVVNDYLRGTIVWAKVPFDGKVDSHYCNKVGSSEIDFTRRQFPESTVILPGVPKDKGFPTTRDYVLSFETTRKRYRIVKNHRSQTGSMFV